MNYRNAITSIRSTDSTTITRRTALRALAGAGVAVMTAGTLRPAVAEHTSQLYTVTVNANFRTGPGVSYPIITVIAKGATFTLNGQSQNGYAGVISNGRSGWVLASIVVAAGTAEPSPVISGTGWTTTSVYLRSGPGTTYQALRLAPTASRLGTSTTVRNGFRYVTFEGLAGWMADAYISSTNPDDQGGNYATTTVNLNLRAEPSLSAKILTVIPAGKKVQVLHSQAGQFVNVNYGGYQGWVALAYLRFP